MKKKKKFTLSRAEGFTLIEMLIVIAVISILAGIVLTGITGFQASARDTRRIADVKSTQNLIELYFVRCGHYPGNRDCLTDTVNSEAELNAALEDVLGEGLPHLTDNEYVYYSADPNSDYTVGVRLEEENSVLRDDIDRASNPTCNDSGDEKYYCVGP